MNFLQMFHQLLGQVRQVDERHLNVRWHLFVLKVVWGAYMDLISDFFASVAWGLDPGILVFV